MPSPFPGMDPYLEGELWQEFHETLAGAIRAQIVAQLPPSYVALLAKRYVLDQAALGIVNAPRVIYPDVHVATHGVAETTATAHDVATVDAPEAEVASYMDAPQLSVEIRDVAQRRLVTAIEILSPSNKNGEGYHEYQARRADLLRTQTHLLEIDLLRQGTRIPLAGHVPPASYYVYLSRYQRRPRTQVWPARLRERLPVVPVPLLPPDPDVPLDLGAAVRACFALVGYERLLDYQLPPPPPALDADDAAWLDQTLRAAGARQ